MATLPFYFAWVDDTATTWDLAYKRKDEDVFFLNVSQNEGDFALLEVDIRNPKVGLLCATRKQWVWLSREHESVTTPLFFGRLVGVPNEINKNVIRLVFMARPANFNVRKEVLANSLKYAPYWDPVFIDPNSRGDPNVVLEARPALYHVDRITHDVSISNIIVGEDGTENLPVTEVIADTVSIQIEGRPLRAVTINADVGWKQPALGSTTFYDGYVVSNFTADGLVADWPKVGANVGGGWKVVSSSAANVPDYKLYNESRWKFFGTPPGIVIYNSDVEPPNPNQTLADTLTSPNFDYPGETLFDFQANHTGRPIELNLANATLNIPRIPRDWIQKVLYQGPFTYANWDERLLVPMWHAKVSLSLGYATTRDRVERLSFTMHADVQDIITLATAEESPIISISGTAVDEAVDIYEPADIPIVDPRRRSYFPTDRGLESVEYLLSLARARLLMGARVVKVSCQLPFDRAVDMTLRKSATIHDSALPAGAVTGKIISYSFSCDGNTGELIGSVTIACAIGKGNALSASVGEADYVDDDCLDPDIQEHVGEIVLLDGSDVGYSVPTDAPNDDGLVVTRNLRRGEVIIAETFTGNAHQQQQAILGPLKFYTYKWNNFEGADVDAIKAQVKLELDKLPTTLRLELKPIEGGPFLSEYTPTVTNLVITKGIDLEVCS